MQDCFKLLHFHLGSQIPNIRNREGGAQRSRPDLSVSLQMARRRELTPAGWARPYLQRHKVRGVFAADDPLPALGVPAYARSKIT